MPSTRASSDGVLKPMIDNIDRLAAPATPGTKVRKLQAKLDERDAENQALKANLDDLTKAFGKLEMVKEKAVAEPNAKDGKKSKKDKNAPVPYKTAYKFFCDDVPAHVTPKERQLAWKQCPANYRTKYESYATADKVRFDREMAAYKEEQLGLELLREKKQHQEAMEVYNAHLVAQQRLVQAQQEKKGKKKKIPKDDDAPKRPLSSYLYFANDKRASVVAKHPNVPQTEIAKILGTMWSKLDKNKPGARGAKKYEDMAAADRARYQEEKEKYDAIVAERNIQAEQERLASLEQEKQEARALLHNMRNGNNFVADQNANMVASLDGASVVSDLSGSQDGKTTKDPNAPKGPKSAYNCFVAKHFVFAKSQMPENSSTHDVLAFLGDHWPHLPADERAEFDQMAAKDRERYNWEMAQYAAKKQQGYF
eukprot:CAMPEP_0117052814 /NCGR_PEP_ID=MMETSP0472-20121206/36505_1 /TAXON_ID=693140 ORGANISM="Tiarina fusus, Strain LIS" /NCGR_SAMPLE_ID=MMETSP0472 /ASSEMBLY_ACC=CAM_ASM_000603 /LENGTH=423 /DNA_ID=CAMNT_0004767581 /DNA_START=91 /DNA_END=1362 /DNA_ORIENTATION=+